MSHSANRFKTADMRVTWLLWSTTLFSRCITCDFLTVIGQRQNCLGQSIARCLFLQSVLWGYHNDQSFESLWTSPHNGTPLLPPYFQLPVIHRHSQDSDSQVCPGRAISIHSRFNPLLTSLFILFVSKFLWMFPLPSFLKCLTLMQHRDVSFSAFWTHTPSILIPLHNVINFWIPFHDLRKRYPMFPSNSKNSYAEIHKPSGALLK